MSILRLRDERPDDEQLIPAALRKLFGRGSVPSADPALYPSAHEIRAIFDRVHEQVLTELAAYDPVVLDQPAGKPHRFAKTKLDCVLWCSRHELVHAGQVALLRRMLGKPPQW
jgi:hypothetical protein